MNTSENNNEEVSFTDSNTESQLTESRIMEGVTSQSTPTSIKKENNSEMMSMMQLLLSKFDSKFEEQKSDSNVKYDKINTKFDEMNTQNVKFEINMNKNV